SDTKTLGKFDMPEDISDIMILGAVIAISVVPMIVTTVGDLTGTGMPLDGTLGGTLLDLAPIVFIAGVLAFLFARTNQN
ncbi:MAG: hypothetical protein QXI16_00595, partial [Sulfolobaceae archaeon]